MKYRKFFKLIDGSIINTDAIQSIVPAYANYWEIIMTSGQKIIVQEKEYNVILNHLSSEEAFVRI